MEQASEAKAVELAVLKNITREVMEDSVRNVIAGFGGDSYQDYHGFQKARLPKAVLDRILGGRGLTEDDVQIEIVRVTGDLTHEVHDHKYATAYVTVLGEKHGFSEPKNGYAFFNKYWREARSGDIIKIAQTKAHGFTVEGEGVLYFLSIQSPAIVRAQGQDDYHRHEKVPLQGNTQPRIKPGRE